METAILKINNVWRMICGVWGTLAVGIVVELANSDQFPAQVIGVGIVGAFCVIASFIILTIAKVTIGLRSEKKKRLIGLTILNTAWKRMQILKLTRDNY